MPKKSQISHQKTTRRKVLDVFFFAVEALPLYLIINMSILGGLLIVLLLFDSFSMPLLVGAAVVSSVVSLLPARYVHVKRPGSTVEGRFFDIVVIIGVLLWFGFNIFYTSQHVLTDRDPATYAVAGIWLSQNDSIKIPYSEVFSDIDNVKHASAGFHTGPHTEEGVIYAQGQNLLPAFLGFAGKFIGEHYLLHVNPLFGATTLLAVYAFARLLVRPRWAALATAIVGVSLPMIYFSRSTYTEPLAATFTFGSLALIWIAQLAQRYRLLMWLTAGLVAGAGVLTRIDAFLIILALVIFAFIYLIISQKRERGKKIAEVAMFMSGMAILSVLGWLDTQILSPYYYEGHANMMNMQLLAIGGASAVGVLATAIFWKTKLLLLLDTLTRRWRRPAILLAMTSVAGILASRPLWDMTQSTGENPVITMLQEQHGLPLDSRSYYVFSVEWVSWYIGVTVLLLGAIGIAIAASKAFSRYGILLFPPLLVIAASSLLYFAYPNITPDQIWAIRRFLPVTIPGLAIFTVFALDWLSVRASMTRWTSMTLWVMASLLLLVLPMATTAPFIQLRERTQLATVQQTCEALPDNAAIVWSGFARDHLTISSRSLCALPAAGVEKDVLTKEYLAGLAVEVERQDKELYIGVYGEQLAIVESYNQNASSMTRVAHNQYEIMEQTLTQAPQKTVEVLEEIYVGRVTVDGKILPLRSDSLDD